MFTIAMITNPEVRTTNPKVSIKIKASNVDIIGIPPFRR